jgi:hypothetical protein
MSRSLPDRSGSDPSAVSVPCARILHRASAPARPGRVEAVDPLGRWTGGERAEDRENAGRPRFSKIAMARFAGEESVCVPVGVSPGTLTISPAPRYGEVVENEVASHFHIGDNQQAE